MTLLVDTRNDSNFKFDFNAEHNGVACIASLIPEDAGTERQFWFTVAMFVEIFGESKQTISNNIASLIDDEEVSQKNLTNAQILDLSGVPHKTTLYSLEVLNKLGMCCFRGNKKAKEIRNRFNDVLVKEETKTPVKTYSVQDFLSDPDTAIQVLTAYKEEKIKRLQAEAERDEAIHTKTQYQEGLAAQMSGRVGGLVKANNVLREENSELKDAVGRGANWRTIGMMKVEWIREFGHAPVWQKLKQFSKDVCIEPIKDVEEKVVLADGSEKTRICFRYHREAWARYRKYEENLRVGDMEIMSI